MSTWDERARRRAKLMFPTVPVVDEEGHLQERGLRINREVGKTRTAYVRGAAWQREQMLAELRETAVEREAQSRYQAAFGESMSDHARWCKRQDCDLTERFTNDARRHIHALLGGHE